jgi:hypothetical protein
MRALASFIVLAVAGLVCFAPLPSEAAVEKAAAPVVAEPAAPVPAEDLVRARKVALLNRYFKAMHFDEMMAMMSKSMVPAMLEEMRKQQPKMSDADTKIAIDAVTESMAELTPVLITETSKAYADVFSEDELLQIVTFYEGPVGQNLVEKSPALMAKTGDLMRVLIPQMQARVAEKMCQKTNCTQKPAKQSKG